MTIKSSRKIVVNGLSPEKVDHIYETRLLLECYAAGKAAKLRSEASLEKLQTLWFK